MVTRRVRIGENLIAHANDDELRNCSVRPPQGVSASEPLTVLDGHYLPDSYCVELLVQWGVVGGGVWTETFGPGPLDWSADEERLAITKITGASERPHPNNWLDKLLGAADKYRSRVAAGR